MDERVGNFLPRSLISGEIQVNPVANDLINHAYKVKPREKSLNSEVLGAS